MALFAITLLVFSAPVVVGLGDCVGTIAGIPLHNPEEGSAALQSALSLTYAAVVDPANPTSVVIPVSGAVLRAGPNGTLSTLAGVGSTIGSTNTSAANTYARSVVLRGATLAAVAAKNAGIFVADSRSIWLLHSSGNGRLVAVDTTLTSAPQCLHVDEKSGDLYYCDGNSTVRVFHPSNSTTDTVINGTLFK